MCILRVINIKQQQTHAWVSSQGLHGTASIVLYMLQSTLARIQKMAAHLDYAVGRVKEHINSWRTYSRVWIVARLIQMKIEYHEFSRQYPKFCGEAIPNFFSVGYQQISL